jgi:predicted dithiol-disulfide oxidoreductase (DUF899 family)
MTKSQHEIRFPSESAAYRAARDRLLEAEMALREQTEAVAELRRALPAGGAVPEDYVFAAAADGVPVRLSALFGDGKDDLVLYSYMFKNEDEAPCPMCTAFLDHLDGGAPHITQHVNLAVAARAEPDKLRAVAAARGWENLRLLSSAGNDYNKDYAAESPDGSQFPMCSVFRRRGDEIRHFWSSEMFFAPAPAHPRHIDLLWPLWNFFDFTPGGRGADWFPGLSYD